MDPGRRSVVVELTVPQSLADPVDQAAAGGAQVAAGGRGVGVRQQPLLGVEGAPALGGTQLSGWVPM